MDEADPSKPDEWARMLDGLNNGKFQSIKDMVTMEQKTPEKEKQKSRNGQTRIN